MLKITGRQKVQIFDGPVDCDVRAGHWSLLMVVSAKNEQSGLVDDGAL